MDLSQNTKKATAWKWWESQTSKKHKDNYEDILSLEEDDINCKM